MDTQDLRDEFNEDEEIERYCHAIAYAAKLHIESGQPIGGDMETRIPVQWKGVNLEVSFYVDYDEIGELH